MNKNHENSIKVHSLEHQFSNQEQSSIERDREAWGVWGDKGTNFFSLSHHLITSSPHHLITSSPSITESLLHHLIIPSVGSREAGGEERLLRFLHHVLNQN
ncbi:MAG: hypothetical protein QNJ63_01625 [Calothrix sp. MO_192.B10]|nr:hypothetical protein [Calothrix sp. MO_192.B10]